MQKLPQLLAELRYASPCEYPSCLAQFLGYAVRTTHDDLLALELYAGTAAHCISISGLRNGGIGKGGLYKLYGSGGALGISRLTTLPDLLGFECLV